MNELQLIFISTFQTSSYKYMEQVPLKIKIQYTNIIRYAIVSECIMERVECDWSGSSPVTSVCPHKVMRDDFNIFQSHMQFLFPNWHIVTFIGFILYAFGWIKFSFEGTRELVLW